MIREFICVLVLIVFVAVSTMHSQYTSLFGNQSTSWVIVNETFLGKDIDSCSIVGDTIINSLNYRSIKCYINNFPVDRDFGWVREDTMLGKAWVISKNNQSEDVIVNLSLSKNDSFFLKSSYWTSGIWSTVDTVYTNNNRKVIEFDLEIPWANGEKFKMIEGIGTNLGIFYQNINGSNKGPYLLCSYKDFIQIYTNESSLYNGQCKLISTNVSNLIDEKEELLVFPNPAKDYIKIANIRGIMGQVEIAVSILDINGVLRYSKIFNGGNNILISTDSLEDGLYFIKTITERKYLYTQKIFINRF